MEYNHIFKIDSSHLRNVSKDMTIRRAVIKKYSYYLHIRCVFN